jgi:hypothetical protein
VFYTEFARENLLSNFLVLLPMPLFAIFVAGLYHVLPRGVLATTALVTGATVAIAWPVGIVVATAGQGMAQHGLDPLTVITFDGVAQLMLAFASLPRAAFIAAISLGVAKQSKGIAISGYVLAVLSIPGSLALLQAEAYAVTAIGTLLYFVWLAVLSGMLVRRPSIASRPQPAALLAAA